MGKGERACEVWREMGKMILVFLRVVIICVFSLFLFSLLFRVFPQKLI
jgi:hypothetical protein